MLFQTQAYIIFSQKALKLWDFFFFNRRKQILANTNNRKCTPKRVQRSWSVITQFSKHWKNIDVSGWKINVTLMTKMEKQFGESRGN